MTTYGKQSIALIQRAGKIITSHFFGTRRTDVYQKSRFERVTSVDREIHRLLSRELPKYFPVPVLSEESRSTWKQTDSYWVIDPIDGTTNFITHIPFFCIGIGLVIEQTIVLNAVYNPIIDELFFAEKNCGAWLNGKRLRKDRAMPISQSIVGISYSHNAAAIEQAGKVGIRLRKTVHNTRHSGSTLLAFAYVASGRLEASVVFGPVTPWDSIPALLLIEEVNGVITDIRGNPFRVGKSKTIIASNGSDHQRLVRIVSTAMKKSTA